MDNMVDVTEAIFTHDVRNGGEVCSHLSPGYTEQLSRNTHLTISQAIESCANDPALIGNCLPLTPICSGYGPRLDLAGTIFPLASCSFYINYTSW